MLTTILRILLSVGIAVFVVFFTSKVVTRYLGISLRKEYAIAFAVIAAIFGALFAISPPFALFAWAIFSNLAVIMFVLAATRRYLEDHPKNGSANHRTPKDKS